MNTTTLNSPVGPLCITEEDGAITRVSWDTGAPRQKTALLNAARGQLKAYFAGELTQFELPLHVGGSGFQKSVCDVMAMIPFGETLTYGAIAAKLGASAQAVGNACGGNPIPIIIPCHRVLGAAGLGGFSGQGGVETKVWLLRHEGAAGLLI